MVINQSLIWQLLSLINSLNILEFYYFLKNLQPDFQ